MLSLQMHALNLHQPCGEFVHVLLVQLTMLGQLNGRGFLHKSHCATPPLLAAQPVPHNCRLRHVIAV